MFTVLVPQGVNPTAVNKCIITLNLSLCVNVYCVIATVCQPNYS